MTRLGVQEYLVVFQFYSFICLFIFQLLYFSYSQCTGKDTKEKVLAVSHHHHQPRTAYSQGGAQLTDGPGGVSMHESGATRRRNEFWVWISWA